MKTTIELPEALFRTAKSAAAEDGISLKDFFTEAVADRLRRRKSGASSNMPWEAAFGGLKKFHKENLRIDQLIAEEFGSIEEEEWL